MAAALSLNPALPMAAMPATLVPPAVGEGLAGMGRFADLLAGAADRGLDAQAMSTPTPAATPDVVMPTLPATPAGSLVPPPLVPSQAPATSALPAASSADALPADAAAALESKAEFSVAGGPPASWLQNFERVLADAQALLDARPLQAAAEAAVALDDMTLTADSWLESDAASSDPTTSDAEDPAAIDGLMAAGVALATPVASLPATPAASHAAAPAGVAGESSDVVDPSATALHTGTALAAPSASSDAARSQRKDRDVPAPAAAPAPRAAAAALPNASGTAGVSPAQAPTAEDADRVSTALLASTASRGSDEPAARDSPTQAAAQAPGSAVTPQAAASSAAAIANAAVDRRAPELSAPNRDAVPMERLGHADAAHAAAAPQAAPRMTEGTSFAATLKQAFDAPLSATPGTPGFAPALGVQLSTLLRNGVAEARLHLHPAELGPIAVQIALEGTAAQVQLAADHSLTRQALEQALPQLAGALRDAGFTLAGGSVSGQGAQPGDSAANAGNSGPRNGAAGNAAGHDAAGGAGNAGAEAPARAPATHARRGLVDLYA